VKHTIEVIERKQRYNGWYPWWSWRCSCGKKSQDSWLDRDHAAYLGEMHAARAKTGYRP
jgi:hypothetical protein